MFRPLLILPAACLLTAAVGNVAPAVAQDTPPITPPATTSAPIVDIRRVQISETRGIKRDQVAAVAARVAVGKPGDNATVNATAAAVVALYKEKGFAAARVIETEVSPDGTLHLTVAEGGIARILIVGNRRTRSSTILKVISTRPGDLYREGAIREDRKRLSRLGIFNDVSLSARARGLDGGDADLPPVIAEETTEKPKKDAEKNDKDDTEKAQIPKPNAQPDNSENPENPENPGNKPQKPPRPPYIVEAAIPLTDELGMVDLVVKVNESTTANLAATLGYADGTGALGYVDASEMNLAGTGQRVAIQWQRSARTTIDGNGNVRADNARSAFGIIYDMPALGTKSIAYGIEAYDKNTVFLPFFSGGQETIRSYERRRGARAHVGRQLFSGFSVYALARRDEVGYDAIPDRLNPPLEPVFTANGIVGALGLELVADRRDTADNPSRGFLHSFTYENASGVLGGNRNFQQMSLDLRQYAPLPSRRPGSVFALRLMGGTSSGDLPLSEQFFLGGYDLLRGYDLFSIRGDRMVLATAEARIPIGQGLQGVLFTDAGNAWQPGTRMTMSNLKAGVGAGIRFLSPIGPIRLDAAYGSRFQTYISLGQSF
jgi:outer membrane protein assembly factor BamA